ncbi:hypothetical protein BH24ACT1_BH24ACT1_09000 [soil metagenome]
MRCHDQLGRGDGFVDHYIEDVIYPDEYSVVLCAMAIVLVGVGYLRFRRAADSAV